MLLIKQSHDQGCRNVVRQIADYSELLVIIHQAAKVEGERVSAVQRKLWVDAEGRQQACLQVSVEFDDIEAMHEFSAIVGEKDEGVVVAIELPMAGAPLLREKDRITRVNGQAVANLAELRAVYGPLTAGSSVELTVERGDDTLTLAQAKAEPPAGMVRREVREAP